MYHDNFTITTHLNQPNLNLPTIPTTITDTTRPAPASNMASLLVLLIPTLKPNLSDDINISRTSSSISYPSFDYHDNFARVTVLNQQNRWQPHNCKQSLIDSPNKIAELVLSIGTETIEWTSHLIRSFSVEVLAVYQDKIIINHRLVIGTASGTRAWQRMLRTSHAHHEGVALIKAPRTRSCFPWLLCASEHTILGCKYWQDKFQCNIQLRDQ